MATNQPKRITKGTIGGYRPGSGAKRKMKEATKILFFVEPEDARDMTELAEQAEAIVREANATVPTRDVDRLIKRSEICRVALQTYLANPPLDAEGFARLFRPYLGRPKPPGNGRLESQKERLDTYLDEHEKHQVERLLDEINVVIADANRHTARKADHDTKAAASDLYREAVSEYLRTYRDRAEQLAHDLRPLLGRSKRTKTAPPKQALEQPTPGAGATAVTVASEPEGKLHTTSTVAKAKTQQNMSLDAALVDAIRSIAEENATSVSYVAGVLLRASLRDFEQGRLALCFQKPSTFSWPSDVIDPPKGHAIFGGRAAVSVLVTRQPNVGTPAQPLTVPNATRTQAVSSGPRTTARRPVSRGGVSDNAVESTSPREYTIPVPTSELVADVPIEQRNDVRHGETVRLVIYSTTAIAELLRSSVENVRAWERDARLPHSGFHLIGRTRHASPTRCYTYAQICALMNTLDGVQDAVLDGEPSPEFCAELRRRWDALPDGTVPKPR